MPLGSRIKIPYIRELVFTFETIPVAIVQKNFAPLVIKKNLKNFNFFYSRFYSRASLLYMTYLKLSQLFQRYKEKTATREEIKTLMELLRKPEMEGLVKEYLQNEIEALDKQYIPPYSYDIPDQKAEEIINKILEMQADAPVVDISITRTKVRIWKSVAAAVIILVAGTTAFFVLDRKDETKRVATEQVQKDIPPGQDGAILTLADGSSIVLDNAMDGQITDAAIKSGNKVSYENADQQKVEYNTMRTPRGRQYSLVLSDGTKVWLNAESSITYLTAFTKNERSVSITGEVYFEVASDSKKPFRVSVNGISIQVLGTRFNVNSYSDEASIKTTLLQGSIKVLVAEKAQLVSPGQEIQVTTNNEIKLNTNADVNAAVAWINGFFQFNGMGIESVMKQLERWYDIEVKYEGKIPDRQFAGQIDRNATLTQVLKILRESNVHFKLENRTLLVTP